MRQVTISRDTASLLEAALDIAGEALQELSDIYAEGWDGAGESEDDTMHIADVATVEKARVELTQAINNNREGE